MEELRGEDARSLSPNGNKIPRHDIGYVHRIGPKLLNIHPNTKSIRYDIPVLMLIVHIRTLIVLNNVGHIIYDSRGEVPPVAR